MTKLDFTKPITTRDGRKVTIYTREAPEPWSIHGLVEGVVAPSVWYSDGRATKVAENPFDLINAPERRKVKVWINCYEDREVSHHSRESADLCATLNRLACIEREIEYTVGEWLEEGVKNG